MTAMIENDQPGLLESHGLSVTFGKTTRKRGSVHAVDNVSFAIGVGRTVALVGESGSGKSTIGNAILGLVRASMGSVDFRGERIVDGHTVNRRRISEHIQVVFQDPYGSLNPSRTIGQTMIEPLLVRGRRFEGDKHRAVADTLRRVGMEPSAANRYPAEFSGGQRQRIAIARALITSPALIICDEPVSSLDLSVQAQILNLLSEQQRVTNLSYLFISHDLAVVQRVADDIVILYRGRIVERGDGTLVSRPHHPYTVALLNASPIPDPTAQRRRRAIRSTFTLQSTASAVPVIGCPYAPRCPLATHICRTETPELRPTSTGSVAACHRADEVGAGALLT